jgi:hypothetical protein
MLELAFLRGTNSEVIEALELLSAKAKGFYPCVHAAVRAHMVARLWRDGRSETIATTLYRERNEEYLQPIERLFIFFSMNQSDDPTTPFLYFRKYRRELISALDSVGQHVGVERGMFFLAVAKLAIDLGYDEEARRVLEEIKPHDSQFDAALKLSLEVRVENQRIGESKYKDALLGQHDYKKRLELLRGFFSATRSLGGYRDRNRPALNELLRQPFDYFNDETEVMSAVSTTLIDNRDLDSLLPNVLEVYRVNALRYLKPQQDMALWSAPLKLRSSNPRDLYWRGVALLHHFVHSGCSYEKYLWESKEHIEAAKKEWRHPVPFTWKELHNAAVAFVTKSIYITEADRVAMQRQLRVASEIDMVTVKDIEDYLAAHHKRPVPVLNRLQKLAGEKKAYGLEVELILSRARATHLVNEDLNRIWQLGCAHSHNDLAWRAATVLNARGALKSSVKHAWDISGEKRQSYPLQKIPRPIADLCIKGFSREGMRLCFAVLEVGPLLPELLAMLDPNVRTSRPVAPVAGSSEAAVERALNGMGWVPANRKHYHFGFQNRDANVPGFVQILPANQWSCLVGKISERLGINAWGWSLSHLSSQISDLIPRLASRQDLKRQSGKIAKWLRSLSPEQRAAWQDMAQLSRVIDDQTAKEILGIFVCQLATMVMQNNYLALTSLHAMRAPVSVIWRFEAWLLSETYSKSRQKMGTQARVLVPNSLQKIISIVE